MTRVFIGGSRRISRLNGDVRSRMDKIMEKGLPVVIGDANGADRAVQAYLHEKGYGSVEVFCSDATPRNNVGGWPVRAIRPDHRKRDYAYYATKDRQMAQEASVGLMLWDGESRGTLLNVLRLVAQDKPAVVYISPEKAFTEVRSETDFEKLEARLDRVAARRLHEQALNEGLNRHIQREAQLRL